MSHFYGKITGRGKSLSKSGTEAEGMTCFVQGYDIGCKVEIDHVKGKDHVTVYKTKGSNSSRKTIIAEFDEE